MRKYKCKFCNELIEEENDLIILKETNSKGTVKNIRLHKQCESLYNELIEYKQNEIKWFDILYQFIHDLLNYNDEQRLPPYLITRLQDLRNGTVMQKGIGRITKSKEGYKYEVIYDTFKTNIDSILWSFDNKNFKNEKNRINYMMVIIDNNINDSVSYFREKEQKELTKQRNNLVDKEEILQQEKYEKIMKKTIINKNENNGISKFLDEDDL